MELHSKNETSESQGELPISIQEGGAFVPDLDDFVPAPPKPRSPLSYWPGTRHLRPVLFFFALFIAFSVIQWNTLGPSPVTASGNAVFGQNEYYRLVTALFAHADLGHLLANTPLFLIFGWCLAAYFGWVVFPVAALAIGVISNLITIYFYQPGAQLLGASGMLYGMVGLWLVLYVRFDTGYKPSLRIFRALGVALLLLFPTTFVPTTSYLAHGAGFAVGLATGGGLAPFLQVRTPEQGTGKV